MDLEKGLSAGDRWNLQSDLFFFATQCGPFGPTQRVPMFDFDKWLAPPSPAEGTEDVLAVRLPYDAVQVQALAQEYITLVVNGESQFERINSLEVGLVPWGPNGTYQLSVSPDRKELTPLFVLALMHTLRANSALLRYCPACERVFLADRRNQGFCSRKCQTRTATRRFRRKYNLHTGKRGRPPKNKRRKAQKRTIS